jgi:GTP pyrophosphokinase
MGYQHLSPLMRTQAIALEHGATEDEAIAALLHDSVEDQGGDATRQTIRRLFGQQVVEIINGCTDAETDPKPEWGPRKKAYIAHIRQASPSVRLVSAADKLHNARTILADYRMIGEEIWKRFTGGRDGTLWYYQSLVEAFREAGSNTLVEELNRVVSEIEQLAARAP